jgi:hypothetical protein
MQHECNIIHELVKRKKDMNKKSSNVPPHHGVGGRKTKS